ncbi:multiple sugar transport system permease protein [Lentzea xinjiangensis]|uniref:Multiple sugar transport system permease protein n=1 Tax=Lentzea xinjiangensis TaxID=402600 RepID=A0A1H8ZHP2_9PSEU|nr:carbohydrate ABC transporter permease [Lentzea xinjiangensis]SEP63803.1 multiple sugar transport system permease protein [Lentzea xinjiangensis]
MRAARYLALSIAAALFLVPFYLVLRNGLASEQEITSPSWTFWPGEVRWENFADLFANPAVPLVRSLVNSVVVAVLQTAGQLLLCGLAGYGLARIPYRYANAVLYLVIATLMIPAAVTFVPTFVVVSTLGWISDLRGLVVPGLFSGFTTFLFRQYFLTFPKEVEEAARVDGLGHWGTYWRVVVPNSKGFFAALGVIAFMTSWNQFLWPLVIAQDRDSWTVQVALSTFLTAQSTEVGQLFLAAAVSVAPLVIVFVALQRFLVRGVVETGMKG